MQDEKDLSVILLSFVVSSICEARSGDTQQDFVL